MTSSSAVRLVVLHIFKPLYMWLETMLFRNKLVRSVCGVDVYIRVSNFDTRDFCFWYACRNPPGWENNLPSCPSWHLSPASFSIPLLPLSGKPVRLNTGDDCILLTCWLNISFQNKKVLFFQASVCKNLVLINRFSEISYLNNTMNLIWKFNSL